MLSSLPLVPMAWTRHPCVSHRHLYLNQITAIPDGTFIGLVRLTELCVRMPLLPRPHDPPCSE